MYYNKKILKIQLINFSLMVLWGIISVLRNISYNRLISIMLLFLGFQQLIWAYNYYKLRKKALFIAGIIFGIILFILSVLNFLK